LTWLTGLRCERELVVVELPSFELPSFPIEDRKRLVEMLKDQRFSRVVIQGNSCLGGPWIIEDTAGKPARW
jgi:hypothetical protein